jgi:hypothetical protein
MVTMKKILFKVVASTTPVFSTFYAFAEHDQDMPVMGDQFAMIFGLMELPILFLCVIFSFLTAKNFKGGKFGKGMTLVAWGFLVMAIGHLHMQIEHHFGINLFQNLLGQFGGQIAWYLALLITWGLSGFGFYTIYKMSK